MPTEATFLASASGFNSPGTAKGYLFATLALLLPSLALGQESNSSGSPANGPRVVKLAIHPAVEPRAALQYRLLPPLADRRPGNAAIQYYRASVLMLDSDRQKTAQNQEKVSQWLELPLEKLPREEVRGVLRDLQGTLAEVDRAARREQCEWDLPIREENVFSILLPEVQHMRSLARFVAIRARLQIAEGQLNEAVHSLQTGYAMARHTAQGPTLIHGLVGIAIGQMMAAQVEELIQQPGVPNLYWTLTNLPRPLIDMRPGIEAESNNLLLAFPFLKDLDESRNDLAYWQHVVDQLEVATNGLGGPPKLSNRPAIVALAIRGYPLAKQLLIQQGRSATEVEAMPVPKVMVLGVMQNYRELQDRIFKWFGLPYYEARAGMVEANQYLWREGRHTEIMPLASLMLPAVSQVQLHSARGEREVAMLRAVEALRLYTAGHQGQLPDKLSDVVETPIPVDPITGQPFVYNRNGETAIVEGKVPSGVPASYGLRVELRIVKN